MTITKDEEYKMICAEADWTRKAAEQKYEAFHEAEREYRLACFRAETTMQALIDFVNAHPEYKNRKDNDND